MSYKVQEATLFEATRIHGQTTEFLHPNRGWDLEYDGIVLWVRAAGSAVLIPNANIKSLTLAEGQLQEVPQPGPTLAEAPEPTKTEASEPEQRKRGR